ncbi:transposase, partial [Escherichia coli]|nr:transposase [Escherichia coli]
MRQSGVHQISSGNQSVRYAEKCDSGRRKGCPNYPPEFKQQLVAASCEPGISISKLALENGINANLLFKWRQQWREGKLLLPSSESPQLLPVTLDAAAEQPESL